MRSIILLILTIVSFGVLGGSLEEKVTIQKIDNQYSINYFNYKPDVIAYFENIGLQGGGYTWEVLVKAALTTKRPELLSEIEFDPEGDAFFAYTKSESVADAIKVEIEKLSVDLSFREKCINVATKGGYIE